MMVRAARRTSFAWLEKRTGLSLSPNARAVEAVDKNGNVRGQVAFDGWTPTAVQAHMAADNPIVWRSLLVPALEYVFEQSEKTVLIGIIPSHNSASRRFARAVGFRDIARIKDGWGAGDDLVIYQLRKEDAARWLTSKQRKAA